MDDHPDYSGLPGEVVTPDQIVAANLRYYRLEAGLTQKELGDLLGLSFKNVSAMEQSRQPGTPPRRFNAEDLVRIATVLGIPVPALLMPPPDEGISRRYLVQQDSRTLTMADYAGYISSDPDADDPHPLAAAYVRRWSEVYGPTAASELAAAIEQAQDALGRPQLMERLSRQRAALAEVISDIDNVTGILAGES